MPDLRESTQMTNNEDIKIQDEDQVNVSTVTTAVSNEDDSFGMNDVITIINHRHIYMYLNLSCNYGS